MAKFDTVDAYIAAREPPIRDVLEQVRALIQGLAPDAMEGMSYGMPGYKLAGKPLVYFGAFAKHWSLFPAGEVDRLGPDLAKRLQAHRGGKGTLKFPYAQGVPTDLIKAIVEERVRQNLGSS